ncbi:hypothetical protein Trco_001564 [Trichoderma cornu-damae]|uniref:Uncharacterized protein n=1 Tax=Trichoderma cornu-damae TaxID=654480 RepID=A0A9P8U1C9_9HYPO|nr:hypothetical protein Trco_001564 [Trichoderma cornu-damae]
MNLGNLLLNIDLLFSQNATSSSSLFSRNRIARGNTPSGAHDHVLHADAPPREHDARIWVVDRILEAQTIPHFLESIMFGILSDGSRSSFPPLPMDVVTLMQQPLASWAPPPFDASHEVPLQQIMVRIGSNDDPARLVVVSKELHSMKSRLWEGIMPLSARRWEQLALDSPDNFHAACQYLCAVTNTFHYLNLPPVKAALRETYNLIWGHLAEFEEALNAKNRLEEQPEVRIAARWHEYIRAHFAFISSRSHRWVVGAVDRLRVPVLEEFAAIASSGPEPGPRESALADKLHDLLENAAQADSAIFLPMDGYEGEGVPSQDDAPPRPDAAEPYRKEPISFSANTHCRVSDYYLRVKYLSRTELWLGQDANGSMPQPGLPTGSEPLLDMARTAQSQVRAQEMARLELRGEPAPLEREIWVEKANQYLGSGNNFKWGYVAYRLSHHHTDDEWETFKTRFGADVEDWGRELNGVDEVRRMSKIHWRDARDLGVADGDVDALRTQFRALRDSDEFPSGTHPDIVLAADEAVIDSYLRPSPQQQGGFVVAIDVDYDPDDMDPERLEESPGYTGAVRVLGSLLWDDVGALAFMQTQYLFELWPLAMHHPEKVYEGPLGGR